MKPVEVLKSASNLVGGDRAKQHGDYTLLHERVAELWSTYLKADVSTDQVVFCMTLLKIARSEFGSKNPDDGVDATAYTAIWAAILEQKDA
jgi:hypothetical protein